jgi:hypothetical protein
LNSYDADIYTQFNEVTLLSPREAFITCGIAASSNGQTRSQAAKKKYYIQKGISLHTDMRAREMGF